MQKSAYKDMSWFTVNSNSCYRFVFSLSIDPGPDFSLLHKCDLCPIYFETTEKRAAHKFDEHKEKLTCKICDRYFRTLKTLESHNVANHRNDIKIVSANPTRNPTKRKEKLAAVKAENRHECPHCDQSYASTMDLDSHLTEHGNRRIRI